MSRRHSFWLKACVCTLLLSAGIAVHAASPITAIRDVFGRDVIAKGITIVDWEGFMANPATKYHFEVDPAAAFPLRVTINSNGHRIDFDDLGGQTGFRATGLSATTGNVFKVQIIPSAAGGDFYVSTYPDRDGLDESYTLTFNVVDARNAQTNFTVPLTVRDYDQPNGPQGGANLHLDYSRDPTGFFNNPDVRRLTDQAAADYAYFLDDQQFTDVAASAEFTQVFSHNLATYSQIPNATKYNGLLLYEVGMDTESQKRSTGLGAPNGGFQTAGGVATSLRRSAVEAIYITGNFGDQGWYYSPLPASEDDWTHTYYSNDIPDYYSVAQHEMGHAIGFSYPYPKYFAGRTAIVSDRLTAYMGRVISVDSTDHLAHVTDPASGIGAFGSEYEAGTSFMRVGRFMITKTNLLVLEAVGWKLRRTSAFIPVTQDADSVALRVGATTTAQLTASYGIPPYNWTLSSGNLPAGVSMDSYGALTGTPSASGATTAQIVVTDYNGQTDSRTIGFIVSAVNSAAPVITQQPTLSLASGVPLLTVTASGAGLSYEWRLNGKAIAGGTQASLILVPGSFVATDKFSVFVSNSAGSTISSDLSLSPASITNPGRITNLSILTAIGANGDSFTMGYVVGGAGTSGAKPLVVRAAGPSLGALGVPGTLDDPKLELFAGAAKTDENDNWGGLTSISAAMASVGAFAYTSPTSKDAAIVANITSRDNSVKVSAANSGSGTVIAEIYDATPTNLYTLTTPRLINCSVIKQIGDGFTIGFVIGGASSRSVLVRAVGPGLAAVGVNSGFIADPRLTLFAGSTQIGTNDNWGGTAALTTAFGQVGVFNLPSASLDAALLVSLAPGQYSAKVTAPAATGLVLVEVYEMP